MIALLFVIVFEVLLVVVGSESLGIDPLVRGLILCVWLIVGMASMISMPPRPWVSRLMWAIAMWAYLIALPRYLGTLPVLASEPWATLLPLLVMAAMPLTLIFVPVLALVYVSDYFAVGRARVRRWYRRMEGE